MDIRKKKKLAKKRARRAKSRRDRAKVYRVIRRERLEAIRLATKILENYEIKKYEPFKDFLVMLYFMLTFFNQKTTEQEESTDA